MKLEEALQIAIEILDDASDYLTSVHDGFPIAEKQADELMTARNALHKALEEKREWVGLTDDEIEDLWGDIWGTNTLYIIAFGKELEAKLKEKNT